ncbi:MAG: LPS export ABC transporter periplasmic protein LptC [Spirochaetaceae bacterium]|nr:LPS export ABC transporter periplasmic protein LptC [Spirochaetaceae bacterium]
MNYGIMRTELILKKGFFSGLAILPFLFVSCSLDYGTQNEQQKRILPEMILSDVNFARIEKFEETATLQAATLEIFKEDDTIYGNDVSFKSYDNKKVTATGSSEFIKIDNRTSTYLLLGNTNINSIKNGITINSENLKWNDKTSQLTSDDTSVVTIHKLPDAKNNSSLTVTGSGFAFSALSLNYVFNGKVNATIETKN